MIGQLPRAALALIGVTLLGQVVALTNAGASSAVLGLSLLVLDALGLAYGLRAARRTTARTTWRLAAAGRGLSLASTISFSVDAVRDSQPWWWVGVGSGLAMFACLTAAALSVSAQRLETRQRLAFIAEVVTVLSSGFMLIWYFVLNQALRREPDLRWIFELGYPFGNLLLLVAVSAVLLRGAVARLGQPLTVLLAGILLYAVGDTAFSAVRVDGQASTGNAYANVALVLASLIMTVAAMQQCAAPTGDAGAPGPARMPAWSTHLPYVAVGFGNVLLLVVTVREHAFLVWGGLTLGQTVMTTALAVRQLISLQDSRRLNVTDTLTRLANVTGLADALERSTQRHEPVALMLLDLDGFKQVNDRLGHHAGDRVLVEFARLLRQSVRRGDLAARVGGDEFVVLLRGIGAQGEAVAVAERVLAVLAGNPLHVAGETITIRCSIGMALPAPGDTAKELQHRADVAMYESKRAGTHGWRVYHPDMADRRNRDATLSDALETALDDGQFELAYQPLVDLGTGRPVAVEALLRWRHPVLGPVAPNEFVPIAERTGAITGIGRWVLEQACRQVQDWRRDLPGAAELYASVNVSARQLREPSFLGDVLTVLTRTGLPAEALVLEITESAIVDEQVAVPALEALRRHGIRVAVDDFGTGYSSLHLLTRLPVDILKIDRSFVAELDGTTRGAGVAEAVIRLAQVLGLTTVAEGIETTAQVAELQLLGCTVAQGYLFAKPMPAAGFAASVRDRQPTA
ncbi:putative bifunctional diguanylate cyclase/phosphodiesterase [Actinoplanes sp. NPDC051494]|uniref:putative bifunctional diguanylate cyclase/phosphodiesterase n=1 Tax=Actinoplanes sp. NPDC051494 TaxID=3363907 RepID=UPI00378BD5F5